MKVLVLKIRKVERKVKLAQAETRIARLPERRPKIKTKNNEKSQKDVKIQVRRKSIENQPNLKNPQIKEKLPPASEIKVHLEKMKRSWSKVLHRHGT